MIIKCQLFRSKQQLNLLQFQLESQEINYQNNINKILIPQSHFDKMYKKRTEQSQAQTAIPDSDDSPSSSFVVNAKRELLNQVKKNQMSTINKNFIFQVDGVKCTPNNLLVLQPKQINYISWPEIFLPNEEIYVSLKGTYYVITDSRNKQKYFNRNSMPNSELLHFSAFYVGQKLIMCSVERYKKANGQKQQIWLHINVTRYTQQFSKIDQSQAFEKCSIVFNHKQFIIDFCDILFLDNSKKAYLVMQPIQIKNKYELFLIDFYKKPQKLNDSMDLDDNESNNQNNSYNKKQVNQNSKIAGQTYFQKKENQKYLKMINSQYGDIGLISTTDQIYQIQISTQFVKGSYSLILKPISILKYFRQNKNTYLFSQNNQLILEKQLFRNQEKIKDLCYGYNGLKIKVLTTHGRLFVFQSQHFMFSQSIYQALSIKEVTSNYFIKNFSLHKLHLVNGLLILQISAQNQKQSNLLRTKVYQQSLLQKVNEKLPQLYASRALLVMKIQSNSISFSKIIPLPFDIKQYDYIKIHTSKQVDQVVLQTISKKQNEKLVLYKCQILSNKNNFQPFITETYLNDEHINSQETELHHNIKGLQIKGNAKVAFSKCSRILFTLTNNQLNGYKIYQKTDISNAQKGVVNILNTSFFQKPQKIAVSPLTGHLALVFKEFVNFFYFNYSQIYSYFNLNIRNVQDISYTKGGQKILIATSQNSLYLIDSYRFTAEKIIDFYGDVSEAYSIDERHILIRSTKNILQIYKKINLQQSQKKQKRNDKKKNASQKQSDYILLYEVKIDQQDLYRADNKKLMIMKKNNTLQIYQHVPQNRLIYDKNNQKQKIRMTLLQKQHLNLINKKNLSTIKGEYPTSMHLSQQLGFLIIGTNFGNLNQYIYPLDSIADPNPSKYYQTKATNHSIIKIQMDAKFSSFYVVTKRNQIMQFQINQFINSQKMSAIYMLSSRNQSKTKSQDTYIYEYTNRQYLLDQFTPIGSTISKTIIENLEEHIFINDKLKDDLEETTTKIKQESQFQIGLYKKNKEDEVKKFKQSFSQVSNQKKQSKQTIQKQLETIRKQFSQIQEKEKTTYQTEILSIYRENDRLKKIKEDKNNEYIAQKQKLIFQHEKILNELIQQKQIESKKLQDEYLKVDKKYIIYNDAAKQIFAQETKQLQRQKKQQSDKQIRQLEIQQDKKEKLLSLQAKIQKEIQKYEQRKIYFQNLIVQTKLQIQELQEDVKDYDQKKKYLRSQLNDKEVMIEEREKDIIVYLKNTNQMKKVKNTHEFELQQYEQQVLPMLQKIKQIQQSIRKMNTEVMNEYNQKVERSHQLLQANSYARQLKNKNKQKLEETLKTRNKLLRLTQALSKIVEDPFNQKVKKNLVKILDDLQGVEHLIDEQYQKQVKLGQKLMRKKLILKKAIDEQQKKQENILRNKNQYMRFHVDNTNLVRQFNQLKQTNKDLIVQKKEILEKINSLKSSMFQTPMKRSASNNSVHIKRKISQIKMTPFQRYEQEQIEYLPTKQKNTSETKVSRSGGQSTSLLKTLIKDISGPQSKIDKIQILRDRIKTFVNPQLNRSKKQVQKLLFRPRGKSDLKL